MTVTGKKKDKGARRKVMINTIARSRIDILMALAGKAMQQRCRTSWEARLPWAEDPAVKRSCRYVLVAKKIAMRVREPLPWQYRRRACKKCNSYLVPGCSSRVRIQGRGKNAHVVATCLHCGHAVRYHLRRGSITPPTPPSPYRFENKVVEGIDRQNRGGD